MRALQSLVEVTRMSKAATPEHLGPNRQRCLFVVRTLFRRAAPTTVCRSKLLTFSVPGQCAAVRAPCPRRVACLGFVGIGMFLGVSEEQSAQVCKTLMVEKIKFHHGISMSDSKRLASLESQLCG